SGEVAGPGTRDRPAGCIARASNGSWASACAAPPCTSIPASHARGVASRSRSATTPRATRSRWRTHAALTAACRPSRSTASPSAKGPTFSSPTTAPRTRYTWCSADSRRGGPLARAVADPEETQADCEGHPAEEQQHETRQQDGLDPTLAQDQV